MGRGHPDHREGGEQPQQRPRPWSPSATAQIEKEAAAHPEFAGQTAAVVTPYEGLFIYGPEDPRGRMLGQLGFTFPRNPLKGKGADFGWSISAERTSDLADLGGVVWLDDSDMDAGMKGVFEETTAFKEGRHFDITDSYLLRRAQHGDSAQHPVRARPLHSTAGRRGRRGSGHQIARGDGLVLLRPVDE